jgi:hypothetical protein
VAATRELKEETNIDLKTEELKHLVPPETTQPLTSYTTSGSKKVVSYRCLSFDICSRY